jgi:predicted enzyme related to lactoylglutathione lyase
MPSLLVNIDVPDLERGIEFYTQAFELRLGRRLGSDFAELLGAEAPIYLLCIPSGTPPIPRGGVQRDYHRHWTPVHLDFVVADLEVALQRAAAAGAKIERAPTDHAYGKLALLSDPFGHGVCLLQFNERGYDAIANG